MSTRAAARRPRPLTAPRSDVALEFELAADDIARMVAERLTSDTQRVARMVARSSVLGARPVKPALQRDFLQPFEWLPAVKAHCRARGPEQAAALLRVHLAAGAEHTQAIVVETSLSHVSRLVHRLYEHGLSPIAEAWPGAAAARVWLLLEREVSVAAAHRRVVQLVARAGAGAEATVLPAPAERSSARDQRFVMLPGANPRTWTWSCFAAGPWRGRWSHGAEGLALWLHAPATSAEALLPGGAR